MATKEEICNSIFNFLLIFFSPKNLDQDLGLDSSKNLGLDLDPGTQQI
jgi:hypothetical protein